MRIAMIGTGYVGLVSGACFSEFGIDVVCVDKIDEKIDALNNGEIPIYEPGLDDLVAKNVDAGRLSFTKNLAEAVENADAVFIAVGTPSRRGDAAMGRLKPALGDGAEPATLGSRGWRVVGLSMLR